MEGKEIFILGVGHNTLNVIELVLDCGYKVGGLIHYNDSRDGEDYYGYKIIGSFERILSPEFIKNNNFALSMGDLGIKGNLFHRLKKDGGRLPQLIHPSSYISRFSEIEEGVQIQPHCVVEGATKIGYNTTIVVNSVIHHNSEIGHDCLISGGVIVGAYAKIGNFVHVGQGAVIVSGKVKEIGDNSILGAGGVLVSDMEKFSVYVGNPAKFLRKNI